MRKKSIKEEFVTSNTNFFHTHRIRLIILCLIVLVAGYLRFNNLAHVPPSPSLDEVSIGWNAYSLLKTGKDEYKTSWPITLRAYDDYRPAMYVYTVIPFIPLFGLSPIAVRLPSVLLSLITVISTYFLANLLFEKEKSKHLITYGHVSSFLLALSPWHMYISRLGHEVNLGLTLLVVGMTFFLFYKKKLQAVYLFFSALLFSLSFGAYQSEKVVVPFLLLAIVVFNYRLLLQHKKDFGIALVIGTLGILPTLFATFGPNGLTRFAGTTAFTMDTGIARTELSLYQTARERGDKIGRFIHSPRFINLRIFADGYLSHFRYTWLFSGGPFDSHKVPYTGLLYPWELIFILLSFFVFFRKKEVRTPFLFALAWLAIGPLPAAITTQTPHAMRAYTMLPMWQIISSVFVMELVASKNRYIQIGSLFLFAIAVLVTVPSMYERYQVNFPNTQSESFGYALTDALSFIQKNGLSNRNIRVDPVFSENGQYYQTYMFTLFTLHINPSTYLALGGTPRGGVGEAFVRGNVEFEPIPKTELNPDTIYVGTPAQFQHYPVSILYKSTFLDGAEGVWVVGTL